MLQAVKSMFCFLVTVSFANIETQCTFEAEVRPSLSRHSLYSCQGVWMH